jgi:hypothetical protein
MNANQSMPHATFGTTRQQGAKTLAVADRAAVSRPNAATR